MAQEIEHKFLLRDEGWRAAAGPGERIRQGYLLAEEGRSVRIRLRDGEGTLTVKGRSRGAVRSEYEYAVPAADAEAMLEELALRPLIEKTRYRVTVQDWVFEVDVFEGANAGLIVAEIEVPEAGAEFPRPSWLGEEVTGDPRYLNASLARHPFADWSD